MNKWIRTIARDLRPTHVRTRLTLWYLTVLALLLLIYATFVFAFQYAVLTRQIFHDEVQDAVTVEGLLYFDSHGVLQLQQDYYSRPQSHLRHAVLFASVAVVRHRSFGGLAGGEDDRGEPQSVGSSASSVQARHQG